jgi:hypothetical protein
LNLSDTLNDEIKNGLTRARAPLIHHPAIKNRINAITPGPSRIELHAKSGAIGVISASGVDTSEERFFSALNLPKGSQMTTTTLERDVASTELSAGERWFFSIEMPVLRTWATARRVALIYY